MKYYSRIFTWRDSPEIISADTVEDAKANTAASTFAREWECDFDSAEGLVYPFDEDFHVRLPPDIRHFQRFAVGVDHGWNDPGCILFCGVQGRGDDATLWILDEVYQSETPNYVWDSIVRERYQGVTGYPDPSRPDRIHDLRRAGLKCVEVDNSIEAGVARVADLLFIKSRDAGNDTVERWARLYVAPHCVNVIREFKSYRRKPDNKNPGRFLEDIEDKNNHSLDCCRYVSMGEFGPVSSRGNHRHESPGS
jgi:hypothetical protein